jgi:hypothetical protein
MAVSLPLYAFAIVLSILFSTLFQRYRKLSHVPGPLLASLTDLWRAYHQNAGDHAAFSIAMHEKHGPIVRVGPNTVHVSDARAIPAIYTAHGEFRKVSDEDIALVTNHLTDSRQIHMDPYEFPPHLVIQLEV